MKRDLVFISYNHRDGQWLSALRDALEPYVLSGNLKVSSDRDITVGKSWPAEIDNLLARTRVAVLLISQRFFASRYIREIEAPRLLADARAGMLTVVCVPVGDVDEELLREWQLDLIQFPLAPARPMSALRGRQRDQAIVRIAICVRDAYRRVDASPAAEAAEVLPHVRFGDPLAPASVSGGEAAGRVGMLHNVRDLDARYVERTDALSLLKQVVLQGTSVATGVTYGGRAAGVHGMGGIGKTMLVQAFCHEHEVRQVFADGIYWLTLGQNPSLLAEQMKLLRMLYRDAPAVESSSHAVELLKVAFDGKRCLLVIDDVWQAEHFRAFDVAGGQSRILLTTRNASLLTHVGARRQELDRLDEPLALKLIAQWVGCQVAALPGEAARVARLCGFHPLALALCGAQIADGLSWSTLVAQLEQGRIEFLDHDYGSVFVCLGRSVDALSEFERARYLELATFPEDTAVPLPTLARLWRYTGNLSAAETEKLLTVLDRKSLLKLANTDAAPQVTFHDLQHDFLRIRAASLQTLSIMLLDAHRKAYALPDGPYGWTHMPHDEPYLWSRLVPHLADAELTAELHALLLSVEWIRAKLAASAAGGGVTITDVGALLADYDFAADMPDASLIQRALRMSTHVVAYDSRQVGLQLYGRLGTAKSAALMRLCQDALSCNENAAFIPKLPSLAAPGALVLTLTGHEDRVAGVRFLPDDKRLLSWSQDRTLKIWDIERGIVLHSLRGHDAAVTGALVPEAHKYLLSWSSDCTLRTWDLERGMALHVFAGHNSAISGAIPVSGGARLLSWSQDRTLRVWDIASGEALHVLSGHERPSIGVLPIDARRLLTWSLDRTLRIWDLERGACVHTLTGHERQIKGVVLLPGERRALSWSADRTLRVWDLDRGTMVHTLFGHEAEIKGALVLPSGQRAVSWSFGSLMLWDLETGRVLHTLVRSTQAVNGVLLMAGGRQALSWSGDCTLTVWDLDGGAAVRALTGHKGPVDGVLLLQERRQALSWSSDRTLCVWDLDRGAALHDLSGHEGEIKGMLLLEKGRRALSWSHRTLKVWDLERGAVVHTLSGHESEVDGVVLSTAGRRAVSWSREGTLKVWDPDLGEALHTPAGHEGDIKGCLIVSGCDRALTWSSDRSLRVWDLETGTALCTLAGHEGDIKGVLLFAHSNRALTWSQDRTLKVWDLDDCTVLHTLAGHEGAVNGALLLGNDRRALSWSHDQTLKVWDLERGTCLNTLGVHYYHQVRHSARANSPVPTLKIWDLQSDAPLKTSASSPVEKESADRDDSGYAHSDEVIGALQPDSRHVLSWSKDHTLSLWDLKRRMPLRTFSGHEGEVRGALLVAEGRRVLSWSSDGTLRFWDLEWNGELRRLEGHSGPIKGALLLAARRRALSWAADRALRVWDLGSGVAIHVLAGHEGEVNGALLTADGRCALSWSTDRTLRFWDLRRGMVLNVLAGHEGDIKGALLQDDGRRALSWSTDRTLRQWDLVDGKELAHYEVDASLCGVVMSESRRLIFGHDALGYVHLIRLNDGPAGS